MTVQAGPAPGDHAEQRIQYARTSDGVNIAYAVTGSGPLLIIVPDPPVSHLNAEWNIPERRERVVRLSRYRTVVRFDSRGTGLSDRDIDDYSLEARMRDLEAVLARFPDEPFSLFAFSHGCQLAAACAAAHPGRVTHLVAAEPLVHGDQFLNAPQRDLLWRMLNGDYQIFTETLGALSHGWGNADGPRRSAFIRECVTQTDAIRIYADIQKVDLTPLLAGIKCPTLVVVHTEPEIGSSLSARDFAAALPDSRFAFVTAGSGAARALEMVRLTGEFFGEQWAIEDLPDTSRRATNSGALRTILFTDIEGHSGMMSRLGDTRGRAILRDHERITRAALAEHGGAEVKALGDGFLATFDSASRALDCAVALERALAEYGETSPMPLRVRVGINAGEPIEEDDDLFGTAVIVAARLAAGAEGGQIVVADVVRQLVAGKGFVFDDLGEQQLRGIPEPVRVHALRW